MTTELHLVRWPIDARKLYEFAVRSKALAYHPTEDEALESHSADLGYAVHAFFAALFDNGSDPSERVAPKPFAVGDESRRTLDVLGYSTLSHTALVQRAKQFSDPRAWSVSDVEAAASRPMPTSFEVGQRLGFEVRACPTKRVKKRGQMTRDAAEVDAFLAAAWLLNKNVPLDRNEVYRKWLDDELVRSKAASLEPESIELVSYRQIPVLRRTQGQRRTAVHAERPDVTFRGTLRVTDSEAFSRLLARGIGRHRSFGFGMLLLRPPRSSV